MHIRSKESVRTCHSGGMQDAVSGVVEGLRMGKLPREEEISDLEKCYQKTVVWVNLVKEQGITDF